MPPPAGGDAALPPEIAPNTPLAQVVKLAQSGVDVDIIKNFVSNSPSAFNLDADKIISLNDVGVPKEVINAMMDRDKALYLAANTPPPPVSVPATTTDTVVETAPPTAPVTVNYFYDNLTPYGSWVVVEGYGRCWRPTVVNYDTGWRPYCDRGHWVYTDCGWYWDSDYSWGVTFHYGRWFRNDRFGWCWYPDTVWGPSWVTWRSSGDYCGWAPLPPLAVYRPGAGFFYRGASVSVSFDFGLSANCFTFVTPDRFCEHHPRRYCVDDRHATTVFSHTTVINNFDVHNTFVVNNGISVTQVRAPDHRPIEPVHVASLPNAGRQGWRGGDEGRHDSGNHGNNNPARNPAIGNGQANHNPNPAERVGGNNNNNNDQVRRGPGWRDNGNSDSNRRQSPLASGQTQPPNQQVGSPVTSPRQQQAEPPNNRNQPLNRIGQNNNWNQQQSAAGQSQRNNGSPIIRGNGSPAGGVQQQQNSSPAPAQNNWQPSGNSRVEAENRGRNSDVRQQQQSQWQTQPRPAAPTVAERTAPRNVETPPPQAPRQYVAPSQPQSPPPSQPRYEERQSRVESTPRNSPPPAAPAQSQRNSNSDRGSDRNSDKDQKNH